MTRFNEKIYCFEIIMKILIEIIKKPLFSPIIEHGWWTGLAYWLGEIVLIVHYDDNKLRKRLIL